MERKSCCSGHRCVSTLRVATPVKMPKKGEDVKSVQPPVKKEDLKPVQLDVKKEAAVEATATAAEVKGVNSEAKETVVSAAVKKEEAPVKVNAGCCGGIGGIGGRGCA